MSTMRVLIELHLPPAAIAHPAVKVPIGHQDMDKKQSPERLSPYLSMCIGKTARNINLFD
jgi:hypothetical protein